MDSHTRFPIHRRALLKAFGLGAVVGSVGGCDAVGGVFGRMFAVPPRETTYFTPNSKFYIVNYADGAVSVSRELNIEQWKLHITGAVYTPMALGWRDLLNREAYDQISTLMCIDTLPGGDSIGTATWRGISLKKLLHRLRRRCRHRPRCRLSWHRRLRRQHSVHTRDAGRRDAGLPDERREAAARNMDSRSACWCRDSTASRT